MSAWLSQSLVLLATAVRLGAVVVIVNLADFWTVPSHAREVIVYVVDPVVVGLAL